MHAANPKWKYNPNRDNVGVDNSYDGPLNAKLETMPEPTGELLAWDPVAQKAAWRVKTPVLPGGGTLATGGNLVFEGRADGVLAVYRATDGKQLWSFDAGTGIMAPPVTYAVDNVQYVTVMAGWGGSPGLYNFPGSGPVKPGYGRILTFKLGGTATFKAPAFGHPNPPVPTLANNAPPPVVHEGGLLFSEYCMACHGVNAVAGALPDLRYASKETLEGIEGIVLGGSRASAGMPSFKKILDAKQVQAIRAYIVARAWESAKAADNQGR